MRIIGNSEEARSLSAALIRNTREILDTTSVLKNKLQQLSSSFQDEGFGEMEDTVHAVISQLNNYMDDIAGVVNILNDYAELLEKQ